MLREHIHIDGMPLHIIDTAGLRDANDEVERIGIERAWQEIAQADRVLFMVDGTTTSAVDPAEIWPDFIERLPAKLPITVVQAIKPMSPAKRGPSSEVMATTTYSPVGTYRRRRGGAT